MVKIDDIDALKLWLTKTLTPICDADPGALAKYVVALVKKDKPTDELRSICLDQLDVFLQNDTASFVAVLFEALQTNSYKKFEEDNVAPPVLKVVEVNGKKSEEKVIPKKEVKWFKTDTTSKLVLNLLSEMEVEENRKPRGRSRSPTNQHSDSRTKSPRRSPARRSSPGRRSRSPTSRRRSREREDRDRRRDQDERRRTDVRNRLGTRYDRGPPPSRRRKSRSRSRSHSPRRRPRSPRPRSHSRSPIENAATKPPKPRSPTPPTPPLIATSAIPTVGGSSVSVIDSVPPPVTSVNKARCRDYDEKGYCMRGDLCPFDHGRDPVIVEDVNLQIMPFGPQGNLPPPVPPPQPSHGSQSQPPPPGVGPVHIRLPPPLPVGPPPSSFPPPPPPNQPTGPPLSSMRHPVEPYVPEPYNPETPSINRPRTSQPRFWNQGPYREPLIRPLVTRQVVGIPIAGRPEPSFVRPKADPIEKTNRIVISQSPVANHASLSVPIANTEVPIQRKPGGFDFSRLGNRQPAFDSNNTVLEIRRIPPGCNNIGKINETFGRFGDILNIHVCYGGDDSAALIQFRTHPQATNAYKCPDPLFNSRFVKVFWHNKEASQDKPVPARKSIPTRSELSLDNTAKTEEPLDISVKKHPTGLTRTVFNAAAAAKSEVTPPGVSPPPVVTKQEAVQQIEAVNKRTAAEEAARKMKELKMKQGLKLKASLQKQRQQLWDKYIKQQKLLIKKLDENKQMPEAERAAIMKTIEKLQESISKVKEEISKPDLQSLSRKEARRIILDAELEVWTKQAAGVETAVLQKRLSELKQEAANLGIDIHSGQASMRGFGRGRGRGYRGRGRGVIPTSRGRGRGKVTIDRRPKAIKIQGYSLDEKEAMIAHFAQLGQLESMDHDDDDSSPFTIATFRTRNQAEYALKFGGQFNGKIIRLAWHIPSLLRQTSSTSTARLSIPDNDVEMEELDDVERVLTTEDEDDLIDDEMLLGDEEEEEDEEGRSWRR